MTLRSGVLLVAAGAGLACSGLIPTAPVEAPPVVAPAEEGDGEEDPDVEEEEEEEAPPDEEPSPDPLPVRAAPRTPPPPPAPAGGKVTVQGEGAVTLVAGDRRFPVPGSVPPGDYAIEVSFGGAPPVRSGKVTVTEDGASVQCNPAMGLCRGSSPRPP